MLKVGLTGGIASGKTTVCQLFLAHGVPVIDADKISRQLVTQGQPALTEIIQVFGEAILQKDGELNRAKLRHIIFIDSNAKQQLEVILHPLIRQQLLLEVADVRSPVVILAVPLLIEAKMQSLVNRICVIDCDPLVQLKRLCERDNIEQELAIAMLSAQLQRQQRLHFADDIIDNSGQIDELYAQVSQLHSTYQLLASQQS